MDLKFLPTALLRLVQTGDAGQLVDFRSPFPEVMQFAVPFELNMFVPFGLDCHLRWRKVLFAVHLRSNGT